MFSPRLRASARSGTRPAGRTTRKPGGRSFTVSRSAVLGALAPRLVAQRYLDQADAFQVAGKKAAVTAVPGGLEKRRESARIVVYVDQEMTTPGTLRRAAESLAAVAERLVALGDVEVVFANPDLLQDMVRAPGWNGADLSSVRVALSGAAPCPWELAEEWRRRTGVRILRGYGMTELFRPISYRADDPADLGRGPRIWKPMIAAVNGYALAGGLELMLCCDVRVAAEHAVFGLTEVRWAIMPGAGGTQRLPRAVPLAKAMEMILMGETCSAQEAYRIGLVNAVVPAADVLPTAKRWAATICDRGPLAVRAAKEAILRGLTLPLADGLRLEAFLSGTLRGTEDAAEGPKAFAEKRKPVFKAR